MYVQEGGPDHRTHDALLTVLNQNDWGLSDGQSDNNELIALAHLFERGEKQVAMFLCSEQGTALITTAGDKVLVSGAVKTLGLAVHVARVEGEKVEGDKVDAVMGHTDQL